MFCCGFAFHVAGHCARRALLLDSWRRCDCGVKLRILGSRTSFLEALCVTVLRVSLREVGVSELGAVVVVVCARARDFLREGERERE